MKMPRWSASIRLARNLCLLLTGMLAAVASAQTAELITGELRIISQPGDPLGIGRTYQLDTTNSDFSTALTDTNSDGAVDFLSFIMARNTGGAIDPLSDWVIDFASVHGLNLAVANYPRTQIDDSVVTPTLPHLRIRHVGSGGCRNVEGEFRISSMRVASCTSGFRLKDFQATFKYRCFGRDIPSTGTLAGSIAYRDTGTCTPAAGGGGTGGGPTGGTGTAGIGSIPTFPAALTPVAPVANPTPIETPTAALDFPLSLLEGPVLLTHDAPATVITIPTITSGGFDGDIALQVMTDAEEGDGFTASISPAVIPAPGTGEATLTLSVGAMTFPRDYHVTVATTANGETSYTGLVVSVDCDPPMILGIDQPQSTSFVAGETATTSVKSAGRGPFLYQWYNAPVGSTRMPVEGATDSTFSTDVEGSYWVRVSNACGTADSNMFHVTKK
jgi:hypothetical protein